MATKYKRIPFQDLDPTKWEGWTIDKPEVVGEAAFFIPKLYKAPRYNVLTRHTDVPGVPYRFYIIQDAHTQKDFTAPSATSVITPNSDISYGLKKWADTIGQEYADIIGGFAPYLGDVYHRSVEWVIDGKVPKEQAMLHVAYPWLSDIMYVIGVELPVVSRRFGVCGTLDLVYVNWSGEVVLVDNKTLHKRFAKKDEEGALSHTLDRTMEGQSAKLTKYRKQSIIYDFGLEETYGIRVHKHKLWVMNTATFQRETVDLFPTKAGYTRSITAVENCRQQFVEMYGHQQSS